jgi:hypothetical protein
VQADDARDTNNSEHQEGAEDNEDWILGSLNPFSDNISPMASLEYDR